MLNNVALNGRLVRDIELKYTPSGTAVATFTIAINRNFKNSEGNREADFIQCVAWKQTAESMAKWTAKGLLIGISGRLQSRSYENKEGNKVFVTEVLVNSYSVLEWNEKLQKGFNQDDVSQSYPNQQASQGYRGEQSYAPYEPQGFTDEDLPF